MTREEVATELDKLAKANISGMEGFEQIGTPDCKMVAFAIYSTARRASDGKQPYALVTVTNRELFDHDLPQLLKSKIAAAKTMLARMAEEASTA